MERGKIPESWIGVKALIIYNVQQKIFLKEEFNTITKMLKERVEKFKWVQMKKIK